MTNWSDAQDWIDIIDHILIGFILIMVAAVPAWFARKAQKSSDKVAAHVVNGHKSPMRSDLDMVIKSVAENSDKLDSIDRKVGVLSTALADEESRRRHGERQIRDDFDSRVSDIISRLIK